jgi:DNA polymerase-3 subunit gamma/tau
MAKKKSETAGSGESEQGGLKPYVVLARKYRPQTFDDLIGQDAMVTTLRNAFASGRIAQGYMLTGVRGIGKTTTARILARALNYERDGVSGPTVDMPEFGRHCAEIMESRHPDVLEMDAASNTGVDNIREIIEGARYRPLLARTKVFIIDEVHMLSKGAFNALLKTLEEPPEHVKFIFATTEIRKVPVTVLSRCQRFDLRRVDVPALSAHFARIVEKEGAKASDDALTMISRVAQGSVRDGLSLLDQAIAMGQGEVTAETVRAMLGFADRGRVFDLLELLFGGDAGAALQSFAQLYHDGADPVQLLTDLAEAVHITARTKAIGAEAGGEALSSEEKRRASALAARLSVPLLSRAWQMLVKGLEDAGRAPNPFAAVEMVLIRLAHVADLPPPDEIIKALGGGTRSAGRPPAPVPQPAAGNGDRGRAPLNEDHGQPQLSQGGDWEPVPPDEMFEAADDLSADDGLGEEDAADAIDVTAARPEPTRIESFADIVELVGARRDVRLKVHLENRVSLVKFDAAAGSIDIFLLDGAPPEIANELREKLNKWTGRRWVVVLSKAPGERPIGEVRREAEAAELERLKAHPAVQAVLQRFPDAKISEVRPLIMPPEDDSATG